MLGFSASKHHVTIIVKDTYYRTFILIYIGLPINYDGGWTIDIHFIHATAFCDLVSNISWNYNKGSHVSTYLNVTLRIRFGLKVNVTG